MVSLHWMQNNCPSSKTDIFLSNRDNIDLKGQKLNEELEIAWFNFFKDCAPRGKVLKSNSYYKDLNRRRVYLLHITPALNEIIREGKILASGGGLGSAIYCSALHSDNSIHNLSSLYFDSNLAQKKKVKFNSLVIELNFDKVPAKKLSDWGVDYTLFGKINCEVWDKIKDKYSRLEQRNIEDNILKRVKMVSKIINRFTDYNLADMGFDEFNDHYEKLFRELPELRFIIYEVLSEMVLLYQNTSTAIKYAEMGELYNRHYKILIRDLCPEMIKKFKMTSFFIPLDKLLNYLVERKIIKKTELGNFIKILKWRIGFYIRKITEKKISAKSFKDLVNANPLLIGQIIYRFHPNRELFEKERAKILLRKRDYNKMAIMIYSILPKGELGINPNLDKLRVKYNVFRAKRVGCKIRILERLNVRLSDNLINESKLSFR